MFKVQNTSLRGQSKTKTFRNIVTIDPKKRTVSLKAFPERDKTKHHKGDLYYGYSTNRYEGMRQMFKEQGIEKKRPTPDDPFSVDFMNQETGVTLTLLMGENVMESYFDFLHHNIYELLPTKTENLSTSDKWLLFLVKNIDQLKLDKEILQMQDSTPVELTKDRFHKNLSADEFLPKGKKSNKNLFGNFITRLSDPSNSIKSAIVHSYQREGKARISPNEQVYVNDWLMRAFFRKTSKLGIDFAIKENKTIHFNVFSEFDKKELQSIVNDTLTQKLVLKQPITHSEIRKVHREYGHEHSLIDMYSYNPLKDDSKIIREKDTGNMPDYVKKRKAEGKPVGQRKYKF